VIRISPSKLNIYSLIYIVNILQELQDYILPNVNRTMLENLRLNINQLSNNNNVKTFIHKLHRTVLNSKLDVGTFTDTLVAHLIFRTVDFDQWPMTIECVLVEISFVCDILVFLKIALRL